MTRPTSTFRVLHVCTGNICRSPMAEHLMRAGLQQRLGERAHRFDVASAGTWARPGDPMEEAARTTLLDYAVVGDAFRAQTLVTDLVASADLILVATREHRGAAVTLFPRAAARTFTLREFARLLSLVPATELPTGDIVERATQLVRAAAARRGTVPPEHPRDDDLEDPYRAPVAAFAGCAALIERSLRGPLDLLAAG